MIVNTKIEQPTLQSKEEEFNWRQCWYPVCFLQDLPKNRPYSFSLYDEPFVLFQDQEKQLICLTDQCSHRAAKLSDGQIIDGKIECLYHGWQFGSDGKCLYIPQLPKDTKIPANACVRSFKVVERQGIVWMWAGEGESADEERIPTIPQLDEPGACVTDYMRDLPYDQTYFIENVIDPAHVPISHDGIIGNREDAQPLEMEIIKSSIQGIYGRYRRISQPNQNWVSLDFIAPNLIIYNFNFQMLGKSIAAGTALYSIPLAKDKCRILLRNYANSFDWKTKLKPRWLDHLIARNKILEGDLQLVVQQKAQIKRLEKNLKEVYLPLKTLDILVIEYRKWLDKFGSSLPFYQGYLTSKNISSAGNQNLMSLDRFSQHTLICSSCSQAYQVSKRLKITFLGVAIGTAYLAILADNFWLQIAAVSISVGAIALAVLAQKAKINFERAYTRQ